MIKSILVLLLTSCYAHADTKCENVGTNKVCYEVTTQLTQGALTQSTLTQGTFTQATLIPATSTPATMTPATVTPATATTTSHIVSVTPIIQPISTWKSGFSMCIHDPATIPAMITKLNTWRTKPMEAYTSWHPHSTWHEMLTWGNGIYSQLPKLKLLHDTGKLVSVGLAMLPDTNRGQFTQCANGDFDANYNAMAQAIKDNAGELAIIRIGWEANGSYPWNIHNVSANTDMIPEYIACFRHIAGILKAKSPSFKIDWTMQKTGKMLVSTTNAYPGDDVVDYVGVDYYNSWHTCSSDQASFDAKAQSLYKNGPQGIQKWLEFAKSHGKKLSIPEWGVMNAAGGCQGDVPSYIQGMYDFLKANANDIAYDTYFNCGSATEDGTKIFPADTNPLSSAKYVELFGH